MSSDSNTALRLDGFLPYRLSVLSNAISRRIADIYEREFNLSIWQWRIIAVLGEHGGLTSTEVAQRTLMDKPTVSRAAAALLERDLLLRVEDKADRRRAPLSLSEKGRAIYNAVIPRALECEAELLAVFTEAQTEQFHALLTQLAGAASPEGILWTDDPQG